MNLASAVAEVVRRSRARTGVLTPEECDASVHGMGVTHRELQATGMRVAVELAKRERAGQYTGRTTRDAFVYGFMAGKLHSDDRGKT